MLTLSTAQTTAPTWGRESRRTRLAIHQAKSAGERDGDEAEAEPDRVREVDFRLRKVEEDDRRQQHVEQDQQRFAGGVGGALRPAPLGPDADADSENDGESGKEDAHGQRAF